MADELVALGLCKRESALVKLTEFGQKCADSAREYVFWVERLRKLPCEDEHEVTKLETFRNKVVLEIGPGWRCNLVRIATVAKRAVGLEIEPVYLEFSRILAKREGIEPPEIVLGAGECAPFTDGEFDWVLMFSALQYMDVHRAFAELKRLLRRDGFALNANMSWPNYFKVGVQSAIHERSAGALVSAGSMVANTLWYQWFGRRLRPNVSGNATARPVHATESFLIAAAERAGLRYRSDLSFHHESHFWLVLQNS
jgi:ubiquinone/menaquinone biosynthesis C-methylase UbiE